MNTPDKIFLIEMGDDLVWCEEPAPDEGMKESDAIRYIREDCTYRQPPCQKSCESQAFKIEIAELKAALMKCAANLSLELQTDDITKAQHARLYAIIQHAKSKAQ